MIISADTWAVVLATAFGPIGAVLITLWRENRALLKSSRLDVFRTLMATRKMPISPGHVNALNLVEVSFYKCAKVEIAWQACKDHFNTKGPEDDEWREKKEKLLAVMLSEMSKELGFKIEAMDIFKGGYVPKGWEHKENRQHAAMDFIYDLAKGDKSFPVSVKSVETPPHK